MAIPVVKIKYRVYEYDEDGLIKSHQEFEVEGSDVCIESKANVGQGIEFDIEGHDPFLQFKLLTPKITKLFISPIL